MARNFIEYLPEDETVVDISAYDPNQTTIGGLIRKNTGVDALNNYFGLPSGGFANPVQDTGLQSWEEVCSVNYDGDTDWVFLNRGFNQSSGTFRVAAYSFDRLTGQYTYKGTSNIGNYNATATLWSGMKAVLNRYTTGTVGVNGTTVTGSGSDWINSGISYGCRIGFGSTDHNAISTWYRVSGFPETDRAGFNISAYSSTTIAVDSAGGIYVGGGFTTYTDSTGGAYTCNRIIKLNPDGSRDASFNPVGGGGTGFNDYVTDIVIDPATGKIYVGGNFTTYQGVTANRIIRLNPDGTKDTAFDNTTGFTVAAAPVRKILVDSSSSIYVCGDFTSYKGVAANRIIKINSVGTKDATFDNTTGFNFAVYDMCFADSDTRLYVVGNFTTWKGVTNNYIIKLDLTGTKDATFDNTTGFNGGAYGVVHDSVNNEIVVGGTFGTWKGVSNSYLTKISATGTAVQSTKANNLVYNIVKDPAGNSVYVSGIMTAAGGTICNGVAKLNMSDLTADAVFDNGGITGQSNILCGHMAAFNLAGTTVYIANVDVAACKGLTVLNSTDGSWDPTFHRLSNQTMTIDASAPTYPPGTPYVIENLQFVSGRFGNSNNYGVYLFRGIAWDDFTVVGTTITLPANYFSFAKGGYYLLDTLNSSTISIITTVSDIWVGPFVSNNEQWIYAMNSTGRILGLNIRKQLKTYAAEGARIRYGTINTPVDCLLTNSPALTLQTYHKFDRATMQNGTASGVDSFYVTGAGSVYQIPLSSVAHLTTPTYNTMAEIPPGSTSTYSIGGSMYRVYYSLELDRLIILSTPAASQKSYITTFNGNFVTPTLSGTFWDRDVYNQQITQNSFDRAFLMNGKQLQNTLVAAGTPMYPDTQGGTWGFNASNLGGFLHMVRMVLNSNENILYAIPISADADYVDASNAAVITPKYTIPNLITFTGLYLNSMREYGSSVYSIPPEPIIIHYRTTGIDDNSGTWIEYTGIDDLNGELCNKATATVTVQFRFAFRVAGNSCIPNKLYGFTLAYEDDRTDSHYSPSMSNSSLSGKTFAWLQEELWNSAIPNLKIRLYDSLTGDLLLYDTVTQSSNGTWEYSSDNGITWNAWSSAADAVGNYIRYVADFVPAGFKLRVCLNTI